MNRFRKTLKKGGKIQRYRLTKRKNQKKTRQHINGGVRKRKPTKKQQQANTNQKRGTKKQAPTGLKKYLGPRTPGLIPVPTQSNHPKNKRELIEMLGLMPTQSQISGESVVEHLPQSSIEDGNYFFDAEEQQQFYDAMNTPPTPPKRLGLKEMSMGRKPKPGDRFYKGPSQVTRGRKIGDEKLIEMLKMHKRIAALNNPEIMDRQGPTWMNDKYLTKQQADIIRRTFPPNSPPNSPYLPDLTVIPELHDPRIRVRGSASSTPLSPKATEYVPDSSRYFRPISPHIPPTSYNSY